LGRSKKALQSIETGLQCLLASISTIEIFVFIGSEKQ